MQINNCTDDDVEYTVDGGVDPTKITAHSHRHDARLVKNAIVRVLRNGQPDDTKVIEVDDPIVTIMEANNKYFLDINGADPNGPVPVDILAEEPEPVGV